MPKRKAVSSPEEEEDSPPKTKREIRAEGKAYARKWAEELEESNKAKSPPRRRATPTKRPTSTKRATPTRRSTAARKSTPKKESPIKSPEPAAKRQKLNSGQASKKLTKKEQIAEAKARAKEWANLQKESTAKSPSASLNKSRAAKSSSEKKSGKKPSPPIDTSPETLLPTDPYGNALRGTNVAVDPIGDRMRVQQLQHQQIMEHARRENALWQLQQMAAMTPQQQQQLTAMSPEEQIRFHEQVMRNAMAAYNPRWVPAVGFNNNYNVPPQNAPARPVAPGQSAPANGPAATTYLQSPPPARAPTAAASKAPAPAPAPASRRLPAMKTKRKDAPVASPPAAALIEIPPEETDNAVTQDDVETEGTKKGYQFLPISIRKVVLPIIVAVIAYFAFRFMNSGSEALETVKQAEPVLPRCFISNPREENQVFENCNHSERALRCPEGGRCSRGQLVSCDKPYMAVSEMGQECVLSAATNETLAEVEALLAEWTIEQTCSLTGVAHPINSPNTRAPFFNIELIKEKVDVDESILSLSDSFVVLSGSDETIIGFTEEYIDTKLIVPFWCYCGLLAFAAAEMVLSIILYVGTSVMGVVLKLTKSFPLASLACFLILWAAYVIRKKRRERAKLRQDVASVRELTYSMLVEDVKTAHVVIHLRDAAAMDLYPTSKSKRAYIIDRVWPRVVAEVKQDNRVQKSKKLHLGITCDTWQWTAAKPTPSKK